jgi:hypothetical protein
MTARKQHDIEVEALRRWSMDSAPHRAMRAAFIDGAHFASQADQPADDSALHDTRNPNVLRQQRGW